MSDPETFLLCVTSWEPLSGAGEPCSFAQCTTLKVSVAEGTLPRETVPGTSSET